MKKQELISTTLSDVLCELLRNANVNPYNHKGAIGEICNKVYELEKKHLEMMYNLGKIDTIQHKGEFEETFKTHFDI